MALVVAVIVWLAMAAGVYFVWQGFGSMTPAITTAGERIDSQLVLTLIIAAIAFVLSQAMLGWFIFRYRDRGQKATYIEGNNLVEWGGAILTGVVFVGLALIGQSVWAEVHMTETPPGAVRVEITAEQFLWNMRYPGPDGRFGRNSPELYQSTGNTVGIDPEDPSGRDDFILQNNLVLPAGRPVELILRSKDVLHSFFVPSLRIKQDTLPGMAIPLRFTARDTGDYEIACAELCGLAHYRMRGFLKVVSEAEYRTWLGEQQPVFQ